MKWTTTDGKPVPKKKFHARRNVTEPVPVAQQQYKEDMTADDIQRERKRGYNEDHYAKTLGGPSACRITIPLMSFDDVEVAADILAELAESFDELCKSETLRKSSKLFQARSLCYQAHTKMKRGQSMYRNLR